MRNRASLAGGLLSRRNWCEVCMNFSCYQWKGQSKGSADEERGETDRHRSCTAAPNPAPASALFRCLAMAGGPGFLGAHPLLPAHPMSSTLYPTTYIPCPQTSMPHPYIPPPASHMPHPPSHILHPPSHTVNAQPIATPILHIPPPVPYTPHLTLHSSHPHSSAHATYPAERQLDNVGSVAGDNPVGAE